MRQTTAVRALAFLLLGGLLLVGCGGGGGGDGDEEPGDHPPTVTILDPLLSRAVVEMHKEPAAAAEVTATASSKLCCQPG